MADLAKSTGVMFGGLRPIPVDPDLDPPAGVCYNCWKRGHGRIDCPQPQVSPLCYNCGRREVILTDCPRCSSQHREYLTRVRDVDRRRQIKRMRKRTKQTSRSVDRKLIEAVGDLRISGGGNPVRTETADGESSRGERGSPTAPPPQSKRTRANSTSRCYYFHLGRESPIGDHSRYSSRETVVVEDDRDGCNREWNAVGQISDPTDETEPKIYVRIDQSNGASEQILSSYGSCESYDGNNNKQRDRNCNEKERQKPSRDGGAEQTDSSVDREDHCGMKDYGCKKTETAADSNWSACSTLSSYGQNHATESLPSSSAIGMDVKNDIQNFLRFLRKMAKLPTNDARDTDQASSVGARKVVKNRMGCT